MKFLFSMTSLRILVLVPALCILAAVSCGSSGPTGPGEQPASQANVDPQWFDLKPVRIPIPEDSGGQPELTRNFYFILDGSGSMARPTTRDCGGDQKFNTKIEGARWAIKQFLEKIPNDVNIGLYVFDNNGEREIVALGPARRDAFIYGVDHIQVGAGTPLARAIRFGTDRLVERYKKQLGYGEYRLVVVTDGIAKNIPSAALYAARHGMPIYTIGLCVPGNHPLRNYSVSYRAADNFDDLAKGLRDTLAELPAFDVTEFEAEPQ